jgi:excisionase family DNA binding protein
MSIPDYQSLMLPVLGAAIRKPPKAKPVQPAWRMLKLKAAADYLGVSTWTLRRILRSGEIPYVQRGVGNILLDLRDPVDAFSVCGSTRDCGRTP